MKESLDEARRKGVAPTIALRHALHRGTPRRSNDQRLEKIAQSRQPGFSGREPEETLLGGQIHIQSGRNMIGEQLWIVGKVERLAFLGQCLVN